MVKAHDHILRTSNPVGFVCIEDKRFSLSVGGVRLISGVNEEEVTDLAKAMTKKLHIFNIPMSGAKAGVDSDKIEDFYNFIANDEVKKLINGSNDHQFITGPDVGTSEEEYHVALKKANLEHLVRPGLLSNPSKNYKLPFDNIITAYSVIIAAEEVLRAEESIGSIDPLKSIRVAIEGFGKVGTGIATLLKNRAKIVAISTKFGCIVESDGFDIDLLLDLQQKYGDELVTKANIEVYPTEKLFEVHCDLLIPGARTGVITESIANKIVKSKPIAIVPAANAPYTKVGLKILYNNGIICFPDFIASAGAVIAAMVEFAKVGGEEEAMILVKAAISKETKDLLQESLYNEDGTTLCEIAEVKAEKRTNKLLKKIDLESYSFSIQAVARELIFRYAPNLLK